MDAVLPAPALPRFVPRRKRPSVWVVLPVLLLVGLSLLPLVYVGLKAWQAGWAQAVHLLWRPYVIGLLRNTLALMVGVTVACGQGALRLTTLQRPGGTRLSAADFLRGLDLQPGMQLGAMSGAAPDQAGA